MEITIDLINKLTYNFEKNSELLNEQYFRLIFKKKYDLYCDIINKYTLFNKNLLELKFRCDSQLNYKERLDIKNTINKLEATIKSNNNEILFLTDKNKISYSNIELYKNTTNLSF